MEVVEGSLNDFAPKQEPVVYPIDATKCKSMEEMGILLNALGMAMTKEYAAANKLEHLLKVEE